MAECRLLPLCLFILGKARLVLSLTNHRQISLLFVLVCLLNCELSGIAQEVQAISGKPYGCARFVVPAGQISESTSLRVVVSNEEDRIFFPAIDVVEAPHQEPATPEPARDRANRPRIGALVQRIRNAVANAKDQINPPELVRVQFLFTGDTPFDVYLDGDIQLKVNVVPARPLGGNQVDQNYLELRESWWAGYIAQAQRQVQRSDYPAIIENYLIHMLGNRFGLPAPTLTKTPKKSQEEQTDPLQTIELVAGVEKLRAELHQETLQQPLSTEEPRFPVPEPPNWQTLAPPATPPDLPIESIATHVPAECFYIRFGSFANFMWFKQFGEARGGDLVQLAVLRGINYQTNDRMERMLNTKTTVVGRLFGDAIISDMAIIGTDLYLQEGPALGVLFEAKNLALLKSSMENDRKAALKQNGELGVKLETVEIAGGTASLLSSPDNRIRSFMVEHDRYLLITTSRRIAERFLEVSSKGGALAESPAFRFARLTMPVSNDYSLFAYLSSEFFRNLVSPQYQIELRRRLKAIASLEIADMASRVALEERELYGNNIQNSIENLIASGYLPPSFQNRFDGSQTLRFQGAWFDSLRGARGSFLPIPDVKIADCSAAEHESYRNQASFYASKWQQTDPLMIGVRRYVDEKQPEVEQLVLEGYIAPLGREKYGWLSSFLGAPVQTEIVLPTDDMVQAQVHLSGTNILSPSPQDHVLFMGIKDLMPPVPGETKGLLATLRVLKSIPGYVGTWPSPGYLDRLPFGLGGGNPDIYGFSRTIIGLWRWQSAGFSVISFDRSILDDCIRTLQPAPTPNFAQGRLKIGDLKNSQVSSFFNVLSYRRAGQATRGNLLLLDSMQQQLHIEPEEALRGAESLLDAKLQCSLGGRYQLEPKGRLWSSTAWAASVNSPPGSLGFDPDIALPNPNYRAPWLTWFRGCELNLMQLPERLVLVGRVSMEKVPVAPASEDKPQATPELPKMNVDLFQIPFQFFQGDKPKSKPAKDSENAEPKKEKSQRRDF